MSSAGQDPTGVVNAASPSGSFVITGWVEARAGATRLRVVIDRVGQATRRWLTIPTDTEASDPTVAITDTGTAIAAWVQQAHARSVIPAVTINQTAVATAVVTLSTVDHTAGVPVAAASAAAIVVAWRERDPREDFLVTAAANAHGWTPPVTLASTQPDAVHARFGFGRPVVAFGAGGGLVAWTDAGLVLDATRLAADGTPGSVFVLDRAGRTVTDAAARVGLIAAEDGAIHHRTRCGRRR